MARNGETGLHLSVGLCLATFPIPFSARANASLKQMTVNKVVSEKHFALQTFFVLYLKSLMHCWPAGLSGFSF